MYLTYYAHLVGIKQVTEGNAVSDFIQCRKFLLAEQLLEFQEELCSAD
jgi:hypothetical protein